MSENYEVGSRYPKPGDKVRVAQKKDYASGVLTEGVVKDVLTSKRFHPRGHKVRLTSGIIGRVQEFADQAKQTQPTVQPPSVQNPPASYTPSEDDLV
jgi:uncharacterized repeat protein (TIGR03833 family)